MKETPSYFEILIALRNLFLTISILLDFFPQDKVRPTLIQVISGLRWNIANLISADTLSDRLMVI